LPKEIASVRVGRQQSLDALPENGVSCASFIKKCDSCRRVGNLGSIGKNLAQ